MWGKTKKRNIFSAKRYKIERTRIRYKRPWKFKKGIFKLSLFKAINIILLLGIIWCLYFFIFSSFYNITNIEIYGNQIISSEDLLDITNNFLSHNKLYIFKNRNIFVFNRNALRKKINEVVLLDNIKIEKILPNTIRVTIKEKNAALKWLTDDQEFLVDDQGQIIKRYYKTVTPKIFQIIETPDINEQQKDDNFLKIKDSSNQQVSLGDKVLNPENIDFIIKIVPKLNETDYLKVKNILVPNEFPQYLIIELQSGGQIYFNLAELIESQLERLNLIIDKKIGKNNLNKLDYIDLRLGENVYFKMK
jgi:hypothetical protein